MKTQTQQPRPLVLLIAALALLVGALATPRIGATPAGPGPQQAPVITVPRFIVYGTTNPDGRFVNYLPNVQMSDPSAALTCDPEPGVFARGGHAITCTASGAGGTDTETFYVLVAVGDDTDVSADAIRQLPDNPVRPASLIDYQVTVRNNGLNTARQPIVTTVLPPSVELRPGANNRCQPGPNRTVTCTMVGIAPGSGAILVLPLQAVPGFLGSFTLQVRVGLGDDQRDLEASLNTITTSTNVQDPGFGPNALFIPLLKR